MATRKLGDVAVGEIVKLKEYSISINYIIVNQGKPSSAYDNSCNGTWLLRQDCVDRRPWYDYGSDWPENILESSDIQPWLNSTMLSKYDAKTQSWIKQVKIPYRKGGGEDGSDQTGSNGLNCKVFLLSAIEVGQDYDNYKRPSDGALLDYFISGDTNAAKKLRLAKSDGENYLWWLRSPVIDATDRVYTVQADGNINYDFAKYDYGVRPAVILPSTLYVTDDGSLTDNTPPGAPTSITIPETIRGGEDTSIIWSASTDPDGNLDGYIVQRSYDGGSFWEQVYQGRSTSTTVSVPFGTQTIMFRVQAYDTSGEKSGWTTSPNRVVINNHAPSAPPSISVPLTPVGGESLSVTWTASTDADGNLEGYELERQWDGAGAFTQIYKGAGLSYQDSIPKGEHTSVVYRVRAYDSFASYSSYTTSPSRTIDNNTAPVIACDLSGDLGEKSEGFSIQYTIKDAEKQEVTVVERVGDLVKRTYKPTLDQQNTFEITGEYFQKILNGAQTVQIVATDSAGKSSTLELTFTKKVHKAVITLSEPLAVEEQITVAVLAITGKIPADATQLIELTNNGNDPTPNWEDATADVKAGRNYVFKNKSQSAGWAFNFRVTVERGESGEDGNIVSIQGGFQ